MTDTAAVTLTPAEKKALKAQAHALDPVVLIGDKGLTPNVVKEIDMNLSAHGLIKVRVAGDDREARLEYAQAICGETGAAWFNTLASCWCCFDPKLKTPKKPKPKAVQNPRGHAKPSASLIQKAKNLPVNQASPAWFTP